jgi:hypothetical protein
MSISISLPSWQLATPTATEPDLARALGHLAGHADELVASMPDALIPGTGFHTGLNGSGPFSVAGLTVMWDAHPDWHGGRCPACEGSIRTARLLGHGGTGVLVGCCTSCGAIAHRTLAGAAHALSLVPEVTRATAGRMRQRAR